jgi:hypothetical protein
MNSLNEAQTTFSWRGAYLSSEYVFMAWSLIKFRIHPRGVELNETERLHGVELN